MEEKLKVVVKVEVSVLLDETGAFDAGRMERLAMVLSNLANSGVHIFIVSSGAIYLGARKLDLPTQPEGLVDKQAMAAVGQAELMKRYRRYFEEYNQTVAQVLLTGDIFADNERSRNARNTLDHLTQREIIPVINENDSVSTEDIEMDDNYYLVKALAGLIQAHLVLVKGKEKETWYLVERGQDGAFEELQEEQIVSRVHELAGRINTADYLAQPFPPALSPEIIQA